MTLPSLIIICLVHPPLYIYLLLSFSLSNPFKFCCSSKAHQKALHSKRKMMFAFLTRSGGRFGQREERALNLAPKIYIPRTLNINFKSDNLHYDTLVCCFAGTNDLSTKHLMFRVFFVFIISSSMF